jgi:RNA-directed DNA polymerase
MVTGSASPDDPALTGYWAHRRAQPNPPADGQHRPQTPHEWERWLVATRKATVKNAIALSTDDKSDETELRLVHAHCHRRHTDQGSSPALRHAREPSGLA